MLNRVLNEAFEIGKDQGAAINELKEVCLKQLLLFGYLKTINIYGR